jgi:hypothetical protein
MRYVSLYDLIFSLSETSQNNSVTASDKVKSKVLTSAIKEENLPLHSMYLLYLELKKPFL